MSSAVIRASLPPLSIPLRGPLSEPGRSRLLELPRGVVPGSRLEVRPAPAIVSSGIASIDALTGGLPRGALTEIFGLASSGRTSFMLTALAEATRRQEICALVDAGDGLHPESAAAAGMDLRRLLWVRCGGNSPQRQRNTAGIDDLRIDDGRLENQKLTASPRINADQRGSASSHGSSSTHHPSPRNSKLETRNFAGHGPRTSEHCVSHRPSFINSRQFSSAWEHRLEQVLKTTDLLLQSGGFGMVVVDLADVPPRFARRIPLASWFRFRRAVENTPTVLLVLEQEPYAKTCASLVLKMQPSALNQQHSAREALMRKRQTFGRTPVQPAICGRDLPAHAQIMRGLPAEAEIVHARWQRKPPCSAAQFDTYATWANSLVG